MVPFFLGVSIFKYNVVTVKMYQNYYYVFILVSSLVILGTDHVKFFYLILPFVVRFLFLIVYPVFTKHPPPVLVYLFLCTPIHKRLHGIRFIVSLLVFKFDLDNEINSP